MAWLHAISGMLFEKYAHLARLLTRLEVYSYWRVEDEYVPGEVSRPRVPVFIYGIRM